MNVILMGLGVLWFVASHVNHYDVVCIQVRLSFCAFHPTRIRQVGEEAILEWNFQWEGARFGWSTARFAASILVSKRPKISSLCFCVHEWTVFCLWRPLRPYMFQLPTMNIYWEVVNWFGINGPGPPVFSDPPSFSLLFLGKGKGKGIGQMLMLMALRLGVCQP